VGVEKVDCPECREPAQLAMMSHHGRRVAGTRVETYHYECSSCGHRFANTHEPGAPNIPKAVYFALAAVIAAVFAYLLLLN
jgi:C4-type Zn-finger protein